MAAKPDKSTSNPQQTMELAQFVSDTLVQIAEGIRDAQERAVETGVWINPAGSLIARRQGAPVIKTKDGESYLDEVKFDVAITVADASKGKAGAGLKILSAHIGADGELSTQNTAASRIQFSIQVVWPWQTQPELEKLLEDEKARRAATRGAVNTFRRSWMRV